MANIETTIRCDLNLSLHIVTGTATVQDVRMKLTEEGRPTQLILWDLTNGTWSADIDGNQFGQLLSEFRGKSGLVGKTAFIVPTDLAFGLTRVLDTLVSLSGSEVEFKGFRDASSAYKWLGFEEIPIQAGDCS
jgi:hypothetical protein